MKKSGVFMVLLPFLPICMVAQEEIYIQNKDIVNKVASNAAKNRVQGDQIKKDLYMEIITKAFDTYWNSVDCQSHLSTDSLNRLYENIKLLKSQKISLIKNLKDLQKKNNNKNDDSILLEQIEEYKQREQSALKEISEIEKEIAKAKNKIKGLAPQVEKIEKSQQVFEKKKKEIKEIADGISKLGKKCATSSLLDTSLPLEIESTLKSFKEMEGFMQKMDSPLFEKVSKNVPTINTFLTLSKVIHNGISQMGKKYDKNKNGELLNEIDKSMSKVELSKKQEQELGKVIDALKNQENAHNYYKDLLNWLKDEIKAIPDEISRSGSLEDLRNKLEKDKDIISSFSDYYTNFKKVFDDLLNEMSSSGFKKTQSQLNQYVNNKINQL